jgi:hypothetical protein
VYSGEYDACDVTLSAYPRFPGVDNRFILDSVYMKYFSIRLSLVGPLFAAINLSLWIFTVRCGLFLLLNLIRNEGIYYHAMYVLLHACVLC